MYLCLDFVSIPTNAGTSPDTRVLMNTQEPRCNPACCQTRVRPILCLSALSAPLSSPLNQQKTPDSHIQQDSPTGRPGAHQNRADHSDYSFAQADIYRRISPGHFRPAGFCNSVVLFVKPQPLRPVSPQFKLFYTLYVEHRTHRVLDSETDQNCILTPF